MAAPKPPTTALGSTATSWAGSYGYGAPVDIFEHIPDMIFPASIPTLTQMRSDPTLASALAAYVTALVAADWHIDPAGATPQMAAVCADSLGLPIAGESPEQIGARRARGVKWKEHLRLACLHLTYGFMPFEDVYEVRDGKVYLKYLAERLPSTVVEVKVNDDGTLKSMVQEGTGQGAQINGVEIPASRLIWYVTGREGAAWTGRSLLRPCYSAWRLKLDTLRVNAIGIARFGAGTPVMEAIPGTSPTAAQVTEAQRLASAVRVGETGGAAPVGFTLKIKGVEGTLPDAIPTLRMYDESMARALLTSLMDLGNTANGSRALGDNFADLMQRALQSIGTAMAETATQLCERLTTFNEGEGATSPVVRCGDVGASKAAIAASITGLITAGAITPDPSLEAYIRDGYHLPPKDPTPPVAPAPAPPNPPEPSVPAPALAASGWQPWVRAAGGADRNRGGAENFRHYWTMGPGAALIGYGTPGQFERCVAQLSKHMTAEQAKGYCADRIKEVTGEWPGAHRGKVHAAASGDGEHTGIMVALMVPPSEAEKLALDIDGAEPADELHLTLVFLGKTTDVDDEAAYVGTVLNVVRDVAARHPVITGEVSGSGRFTTPDSDAVYLSFDSPDLPALRQDLFDSLTAAGIEPAANHGFSPHITLAYVPKGGPSPLDHVETRPLSFSGITFAYGGQQLTAPLADPTEAEWPPPGAMELTDELAVSDFRVHAAAPPPYREPTPQEQAAGIDPAQVDEAQDGMVTEGMTLFAAIVAVWGAAIAAQITATLTAGSLAGLARLTVNTDDAAQGLAVLMREAADAGVASALREATTAGILKPDLKPTVDEAALDDAAAGIADLMGQGLASAAGREAARIFGPGSDPKTIARQAVATVTESDTPIHDAIAAGVTRAMGAGRAAAQTALMVGADLIPFHAGLRDRAQCVACAEHDGTEYPDLTAALADFPSGHYAACLGRANCRCMIGLRPVTS